MKKEYPTYFERFWRAYPRRSSKGDAFKAWEKTTKGYSDKDLEDFTKMAVLALDAQKRYRHKAKALGEFVPDWKLPATWLRADCWLDEIPSLMLADDQQRRRELKTCIVESCTVEVHGPQFDKCAYHTSMDNAQGLREHYARHGLNRRDGESREDWLARLKRIAKEAASKVGAAMERGPQ